ncbi:macro domain protein [Chlamydia ibidis]|uniref:Macro domain protein n=2 Tax=Chlamydia ibidis TaxID=1405396 RepID=S7KMC8_9CHLA|nr:macro domain protein [Chlamydia ibidis]EPP35605.1 macro domain protein [Chlamydia ibidis]EQM62716.1 macro domain protein [Chlamydia ibidis 10-1398/6]
MSSKSNPPLINSRESAVFLPKTQSLPSNKVNASVSAKRITLGVIATLGYLVAAGSCIAAITMGMPLLFIATAVASIIGLACLISMACLKKRNSLPATTTEKMSSLPILPPAHTSPEFSPENIASQLPSKKETKSQTQTSLDVEQPATKSSRPISSPGVSISFINTDAEGFSDYNSTLRSHWLSLLSPSEALPEAHLAQKDPNAPASFWHLPNTKTLLISTTGDIASLRFASQCRNAMIVNAANAEMSSGKSGTNLALSKAVNFQSWKNSRGGKDKLEIAECTSGLWIPAKPPKTTKGKIPPANKPHVYVPGEPKFLAQLLGPTAEQLGSDCNQCYRLVKQAYRNCLEEGKKNGSELIQLPLLSASIFAPDIHEKDAQGRNKRELWINGIRSALVDALQEFAQKNPLYPLVVIVTNIGSLPL